MTDRDKLLDLYNKLKDFELPTMENEKLQVVVNTIREGLLIMVKWLIDTAREHYGKN